MVASPCSVVPRTRLSPLHTKIRKPSAGHISYIIALIRPFLGIKYRLFFNLPHFIHVENPYHHWGNIFLRIFVDSFGSLISKSIMKSFFFRSPILSSSASRSHFKSPRRPRLRLTVAGDVSIRPRCYRGVQIFCPPFWMLKPLNFKKEKEKRIQITVTHTLSFNSPKLALST